jgi:hypothetical protein
MSDGKPWGSDNQLVHATPFCMWSYDMITFASSVWTLRIRRMRVPIVWLSLLIWLDSTLLMVKRCTCQNGSEVQGRCFLTFYLTLLMCICIVEWQTSQRCMNFLFREYLHYLLWGTVCCSTLCSLSVASSSVNIKLSREGRELELDITKYLCFSAPQTFPLSFCFRCC